MPGRVAFFVVAAFAIAACQRDPGAPGPAGLDAMAAEYLRLELSMGRHDESHVDAYFGPAGFAEAARQDTLSLAQIDAGAAELAATIRSMLENTDPSPDERARANGLLHRLTALETRIAINQGNAPAFDEESQRLFRATAPDHDAAHFEAILLEIDRLLPGDDDLSARVNAFRDRFAIPAERLSSVFDAAIAECRRRTLRHIELPAQESFTVEYVNDKPWSGYNWYKGNAHSVIQLNTDLPVFISRAVDLGCHEGYPGHHTFNVLIERELVDRKGWVEYSLYPLFSPQSLIAEGSGNYGIELAFPENERIEFEKATLFPLAGLDPREADRYYELEALLDELKYADNEAARDYLNRNIDREAAVQWLVGYSLSSPDRARQRTQFFDAYRSYVINYNLGEDMVRDYVERGTPDEDTRWQRFEKLLTAPVDPLDLGWR
ncbi:MAG: hypothetical protein ACREQZ_00350 [Woeseiaceae bacterium]